MIKIIKSGKKEFHATCPNCGCEFTYEMEDLSGKDYIGAIDYVECPECGRTVLHLGINTQIEPIPCTNPITTTIPRMRSCEDCDFYKSLKTGQIYVGDNPCCCCYLNPNKIICTNVHATSTNTDVTITSKTESGGIQFNNGKN